MNIEDRLDTCLWSIITFGLFVCLSIDQLCDVQAVLQLFILIVPAHLVAKLALVRDPQLDEIEHDIDLEGNLPKLRVDKEHGRQVLQLLFQWRDAASMVVKQNDSGRAGLLVLVERFIDNHQPQLSRQLGELVEVDEVLFLFCSNSALALALGLGLSLALGLVAFRLGFLVACHGAGFGRCAE